MTQPKQSPQRTCVACGARRDQSELIRIVQGADNGLVIGGSRRMPGRGAYICPIRQCWEKALKGTRLEYALRATLSNENRAALIQYASTLEGTGSHG